MRAEVERVYRWAQGINHAKIDIQNRKIVVPMMKGFKCDDLFEQGTMTGWMIENGFRITAEQGDYEYQTKGSFEARAMRLYSGHTAFLRNRVILTICWDDSPE